MQLCTNTQMGLKVSGELLFHSKPNRIFFPLFSCSAGILIQKLNIFSTSGPSFQHWLKVCVGAPWWDMRVLQVGHSNNRNSVWNYSQACTVTHLSQFICLYKKRFKKRKLVQIELGTSLEVIWRLFWNKKNKWISSAATFLIYLFIVKQAPCFSPFLPVVITTWHMCRLFRLHIPINRLCSACYFGSAGFEIAMLLSISCY